MKFRVGKQFPVNLVIYSVQEIHIQESLDNGRDFHRSTFPMYTEVNQNLRHETKET